MSIGDSGRASLIVCFTHEFIVDKLLAALMKCLAKQLKGAQSWWGSRGQELLQM